jgi:AcrR family transcriptional regulator
MARKKRPELYQERRAQIVHASAQLIQEKGFHGTTLQDVADQLNVTKAALYYYIEDKQELLFHIHKQALSMLLEAAEAIVEGDQPAVMKIGTFIDTQIRFIMDRLDLFTVYIHERSNLLPEHARIVTNMERQIVHALQAIIREGIAAGAFEPLDPTIAAFAVLGASSWVYRWYRPQGRLSIEEISKELQQVVLGGLKKRDTDS